MVMEPLYFDHVKTPFGIFQIQASTRGLTAIRFPGKFSTRKSSHGKTPQPAHKALQAGNQFLKRYFSGKTAIHAQVPIDWKRLSSFEIRVLRTLRKVGPSSVTTYSGLAQKSGFPKGARAVGNALGRNPFPVLIPCHRVLRKDDSLGGFSGGLHWKRRLLKLEHGLGVKKNR